MMSYSSPYRYQPRRRRRRNPDAAGGGLNTQKLVLRMALLATGVWVAGAVNLLPGPVQTWWNKFFNRGQSLGPSFWDQLKLGAPKTTTAIKGTAIPAGTPTQIPGGAQTPTQQASTGITAALPPPPPAPGQPPAPPAPQIGIDLWADVYDYPAGSPVTLSGWIYSWDGVTAQRLPGRNVHIVDPDAGDVAAGGQPWLEAVTDGDGFYSITYTGDDAVPWRSYARDVASGAETGRLEFRPYTVGEVTVGVMDFPG